MLNIKKKPFDYLTYHTDIQMLYAVFTFKFTWLATNANLLAIGLQTHFIQQTDVIRLTVYSAAMG